MLQLKVLAKKARIEIEDAAIKKYKATGLIAKQIDDEIEDYQIIVSDLNKKIAEQNKLLSTAIIDSERKEIGKEIQRLSVLVKPKSDRLNYFKQLKKIHLKNYAEFNFSIDITFDPLISNQIILDNLKSEQPLDEFTLWSEAPLKNLEILRFKNDVQDVYEYLPLELQNEEHNYVIEVLHKYLKNKLFVVLGDPRKFDIKDKAIQFLTDLKYYTKNDFYVNQWYGRVTDEIRNENFEMTLVYSNRYYVRNTSHYAIDLPKKQISLITRIGLVGSKPDLETYSCAFFLLLCSNGFKFQRQRIEVNGKQLSLANLFAKSIIFSLGNHWNDLSEIGELLTAMGIGQINIDDIKSQIEYWRSYHDLPDIMNKDKSRVLRTVSDYLGAKKRFGFYTSIDLDNPKLSEEDAIEKLRNKWRNKYDDVSSYFKKVQLTAMAEWQKDPVAYINSQIPD